MPNKGKLQQIIKSVTEKMGVTNIISPEGIRCRIYWKSLVNDNLAGGQISPLQRIGPTRIVEIMLQMARICQYHTTPSKGLQLINSLIKDTKIHNELITWKKRGNSRNVEGNLGRGYWRKFVTRNREKIVSKERGRKYELNKQSWATYANFVRMYEHCMPEMVEAGVAEKLKAPVWMDWYGKPCNEINAFRCKAFRKLLRPDMCICGDKVGGSIRGDGYAGEQLKLLGKGHVLIKKTSTNDKKFTLIGLIRNM